MPVPLFEYAKYGIDTMSETPEAFILRAIDNGLRYVVQESWDTDVEVVTLPDGMTHEITVSQEHFSRAVHSMDGAVVDAMLSPSGARLTIAASNTAIARTLMDRYRGLFPPSAPAEEDDNVHVKFWSHGRQGPAATMRKIATQPMGAILGNYNRSVAKELQRLTNPELFVPGAGGQLILWHGDPGTGKTWAIRALAREWRKWCGIEYIVDPDAFFGDAAYLLPVMLGGGSSRPRYVTDAIGDAPDRNEDDWRLLIFEDAGELLATDARERTGQGLSRLLNVVDGFIGQGLRTLMLITTNEDFTKLHPAVARPGRCAANLSFSPLGPDESARWAEVNGIVIPRGVHTLAELYAIRDGNRSEDTKPAIGFRTEVTA